MKGYSLLILIFHPLLKELAKYEDTATIGEELVEGRDVTDLIIQLVDGVKADETITVTTESDTGESIELTLTAEGSTGESQPATDLNSSTLVPISSGGHFVIDKDAGRIYLAEDNEGNTDLEDTITLTFTSGNESETLKIIVKIEGQALVIEEVQSNLDQAPVSEEPSNLEQDLFLKRKLREDLPQSESAPAPALESNPVEEGTAVDEAAAALDATEQK